MLNKQAANMSPAENHLNLIPIFWGLRESSISALMENAELCSHCYVLLLIFRWTQSSKQSERSWPQLLLSVTTWDSKEEPESVHPCTTQTSRPWQLTVTHLNHSGFILCILVFQLRLVSHKPLAEGNEMRLEALEKAFYQFKISHRY